jgi:hypothetical protein
MEATCKYCRNPAEVAATDGSEATCEACSKRAQRRRLIFDVGESTTPRRNTPTPLETALGTLPSPEEPSPHEETRMLDLRDLARRTRQNLATVPDAEECDAPLSLREAILLVDSIAPASFDPAPAEVDPSPPPAPSPLATEAPPGHARRRLRAVYSGLGVLVVMAGLVAAKARMVREEASAAGLDPAPTELVATQAASLVPPTTGVAPAAPAPSPTPRATAAPTATPRKVPVHAAPPRPRAPTPADTGERRAAAEPEAPPKVDLMDAIQAAVAAHSAPSSAPKGDCPPTAAGGSGTPSPCARGGTKTSPPHP